MKNRLLLLLCIISSSIVYGAATTTLREFDAHCEHCQKGIKMSIRRGQKGPYLEKQSLWSHLNSKGHEGLKKYWENCERHFTFSENGEERLFQDIEKIFKDTKELHGVRRDVKKALEAVNRLEQQQLARQARHFRPY